MAPGVGQPMGYNDVLALANFVGSDVLISVGQLNRPSDWAHADQLAELIGVDLDVLLHPDTKSIWRTVTRHGTSAYRPRSTTATVLAYGYTLGPNMAAAKSASGYNPRSSNWLATAGRRPTRATGRSGGCTMF